MSKRNDSFSLGERDKIFDQVRYGTLGHVIVFYDDLHVHTRMSICVCRLQFGIHQ